MATETTNFKFKKPGENEYYSVDVQNENWEKADNELKKLDTSKMPIFQFFGKENDLDTLFSGGYQNGFYHIDVDTLNTPYKNIGAWETEGVVLHTCYTAGSWGQQVAFLHGSEVIYIRRCHEGVISDWTTGFLPLTGGNLSGILRILMETPEIVLRRLDGSRYADMFLSKSGFINIQNRYDNDNLNCFSIDTETNELKNSIQIERRNSGVTKYYKVFGEHNKPSGTYTGNGSAKSRIIEIGGTGNVLCITSGGGCSAFVSTNGCIAVASTTGNVFGLKKTEATFYNGVLTLNTADGACNASGNTYVYEVL